MFNFKGREKKNYNDEINNRKKKGQKRKIINYKETFLNERLLPTKAIQKKIKQ